MPCLSFFCSLKVLFEAIGSLTQLFGRWGSWAKKHASELNLNEWLGIYIECRQKTHKRREKKVAAPHKTFLLKVWHKFVVETILQTTRLFNILEMFSLSNINHYHRFKKWSRSASCRNDPTFWDRQNVKNLVLFHPRGSASKFWGSNIVSWLSKITAVSAERSAVLA